MGILDLFRLDGRVALVTGARRGLGQAMAAALAEAGAQVIGLSREADADETRARIQAAGGTYHHMAFDLRAASVEQLAGLVRQVVERAGRLDILVNNAGTTHRRPALDFTEAHWDEVLRVNLKALFFLSQAAAQEMAHAGRGKIINVASLLSFQGGILVPAYAAAKHGVAGITQALANEWASGGINVNAIAPGYMETDLTADLRADPSRFRAILERIPAGRWGVPDDLMGAAVFLASSASDYVNGATIVVDGGWLGR